VNLVLAATFGLTDIDPVGSFITVPHGPGAHPESMKRLFEGGMRSAFPPYMVNFSGQCPAIKDVKKNIFPDQISG